MPKLLTIQNAKTIKGEAQGWLTGILYLAPHKSAGIKTHSGEADLTVCPYSTPGCRASCLYTAGRGAMPNVQKARIRKTRELYADRPAFIQQLRRDIQALDRKAKREGLRLAIRLNGTSDLRWDKLATGLFAEFPHVRFYDYTKNVALLEAYVARRTPENYHITFSGSEDNHPWWFWALDRGVNVAVPFEVKPKREWKGVPVIDGDAHDLRFLDPDGFGHIVALGAKGRARRDDTGFVMRSDTPWRGEVGRG